MLDRFKHNWKLYSYSTCVICKYIVIVCITVLIPLSIKYHMWGSVFINSFTSIYGTYVAIRYWREFKNEKQHLEQLHE